MTPAAPSYVLRTPDGNETAFADVLQQYNDSKPGQGWIDLRPQMQIRVENAYYEAGFARQGLQGYLGTEVARYEVGLNGLTLLSAEHMKNRPAGDDPVEKLVPEALERERFYRLYFEIFNKAKNTRVSALLGAHSESEMAQLVSHLDEACGPGAKYCADFPEACSVSVEMRIGVNGKMVSALWGAPLLSVVGEHPHRVEMKRRFGGGLRLVKLSARDALALRLPLLPGDEIVWK